MSLCKYAHAFVIYFVRSPDPTPSPPPVTRPSAAPVVKPTSPPVDGTEKPTAGEFTCQDWTACVWDHYTAKRAVFSENYTHYACKGSLQDLGLTGYCGGAVGATDPVPVKMTAPDYYELGTCA